MGFIGKLDTPPCVDEEVKQGKMGREAIAGGLEIVDWRTQKPHLGD